MGETRMTGPVKGILQLMEGLKQKPGSFVLANCLVAGSTASRLGQKFIAAGIEYTEVVHRSRNYLGLLGELRRLCNQLQVQIVQTHGYKQSVLGFGLKYGAGCRWICFMHGTTAESYRARLYHWLDGFIQRFADRTVLMTARQRGKIVGGQDGLRVKVIHNSVDLAMPAAISQVGRAVRDSLTCDNDVLFAVIGRLSPEKGVDVFLRAFARVCEAGPRARAAIVGDGPELERLERIAVSLKVQEHVRFCGFCETPGDYLLAADVLVLPSRSEGIPNVILEAMAMRRPVIATRVGGVPEIIENNCHGILVASESVSELAQAMITMKESPELRKRFSEAGFTRVREAFSPEIRIEAVSALYKDMLMSMQRRNRDI